MKKKKHTISSVQKGSIAEELEIEAGDELLSINTQEVEDVFDYHYLVNEEYIELLIKKENGEEWLLEVEKESDEDLGIVFESGLMDEYRSCSNKCIFCFIDQMPPNMRETLYFKDDDSRLSFLQGNYVTLTNMSDSDIERIIRYHMSPINISFQTTNPALRCKMLHNRFAGDIFKKVDRLYEAGIEMNGQIVLCRGINDKEELERSIEDLSKYLPHLKSVSIVPAGLSRYREHLYPLEPFTGEEAQEVLSLVERWQEKLYPEYGLHFVHASDEWYPMAGKELPQESTYDGYLQLENGVGMLRLLEEEIKECLNSLVKDDRKRTISIATGLLAYPFIRTYVSWIQKKFPNIQVCVYGITNAFFGDNITVSGLLTGQDLREQLSGKELGEYLLLPCNLLRSGEDVLLDDMTVDELEKALGVAILVVDTPGDAFVKAVTEDTVQREHRRRQIYEQTDCSNSRTS